MKIIPILLIAMMMICIGFLSGCNEQSVSLSDEEKRFVGTWNGSIDIFDVLVFFPDRACCYFFDFTGIWEIKDGNLVITVKDAKYTYGYSFSNNDDILTIIDIESGNSWDYRRQ